VHETTEDLKTLQQLLDASIERATPFLRRSFEMPDRSLSAQQLADQLQGSMTVALATVTARGEPRVAPINALFYRGAFHIPTVAESARARHLARRPAASVTYFEGTRLAVIVHGAATGIREDEPEFALIDELQMRFRSEGPRDWQGHAVYLRLEPRTMYTYARAS
jgi:pyridoxine/pyridoxamine 5'-phosphate oxidase